MDKKLEMLCNLYDRSYENINVSALLKVCFFENFREVLDLFSYKQTSKFGYLCAKSVSHFVNKNDKERIEECLESIRKWAYRSTPYEKFEELQNASSVAYSIACNRFYIDNAAYSVYAAAHSNDVAYAYYANSFAIRAAICSADNIIAKNKQEQEYKNLGFLVKVIRDEP